MPKDMDYFIKDVLEKKFDLLIEEFSKLNANIEKLIEKVSVEDGEKKQYKKVGK